MSIVDEDKEVKDCNTLIFKSQSSDKIKELGHQLKMYMQLQHFILMKLKQ